MRISRYGAFLVGVAILFPMGALGESLKNEEAPLPPSAIFSHMLPLVPAVSVPTVVEVPLVDGTAFRLRDAAVYEERTGTYQPYLFVEERKTARMGLAATVDRPATFGSAEALVDGNGDTLSEFPLDNEQVSVAEFRFAFAEPVNVSGLSFSLDQYVALPQAIAISVPPRNHTDTLRTVLAKSALNDSTVRFPALTTRELVVKVWYGQPLRVREITFFEHASEISTEGVLRFLARPGERYTLYAHSERGFVTAVAEAGDLSSERDVKRVSGGVLLGNPEYVPADTDQDGVLDRADNCVMTANADQRDENRNGRGDACDDFDRDGIMNHQDNCPSHPNRTQTDTDGDGPGDGCDSEESRLTERYPWMIWLILGHGMMIVGGLFVSVWRRTRRS